VALALIVSVAYLPALRGGFVWDDDVNVTSNLTLTRPGGLRSIWFEPGALYQYYPLVFSSFWVEHKIWDFHPAGYHAVNVSLHIINALLLWCLLGQIGFPLAWAAAALFALHPIQVESVAWITERKNVLSTCFYLASAIAYLRVIKHENGCSPNRFPRGGAKLPAAWAAAFVLYALALLSKPVTSTLPFALLVLGWWMRGMVSRRDFALLGPFVLAGGAAGAFVTWMEKMRAGAAGIDWELSIGERVVVAGKNVWFYLAQLIWPGHLCFVYPRWRAKGFPLWHAIAPLAVVLVVLILWRYRSRLGRGPVAAVLLYLIALAPTLGFIDYYYMRFSFVADHFSYVAIVGPILLVLGSGAAAARQFRVTHGGATVMYSRLLARCAFGALLLLLAVLSWRRCTAFRDEETLWRDTLAKNTSATMAKLNLGGMLLNRGEDREAADLFQHVLAEAPGKSGFLANLARNNLGIIMAKQGAYDAAAEFFQAVLAVAPNSSDTLTNLAHLNTSAGYLDQAEAGYRAALRSDPGYAPAHAGLGALLRERGDQEEAEWHFSEARRLSPK